MPIQTIERLDLEDQVLADLYRTLTRIPLDGAQTRYILQALAAKVDHDFPGGQSFRSDFAIGQEIEWKDGTVVRRGIVYAVTFAEVAPDGIGVWYKVHIDDGLSEVEIEEAGTEIREVWK